MLLGGLLSATDPVAVVALLKDLGASKKISTVIEGESLMNDGYTICFPVILLHWWMCILLASSLSHFFIIISLPSAVRFYTIVKDST